LKDLVEYLKYDDAADFVRAALSSSESRPYSIRQLSRKLGYSSDRGLGMVLKGQRAMSSDMQVRIAKFLRLSAKEAMHLQALVRKDTVCADAKHSRAKVKSISSEHLHPFVPSYSLAVIDILWIQGKALNLEDIRQRLRMEVSFAEIESCVNGLVEGGYLKRESGGFYRTLREEEYIETTSDIPSQAIRAIHCAQLERAQAALHLESVLDREFLAKTLIVSRSQIPAVKRLIREKLEELAEEIALETPNGEATVAQLNMQFYLQSK
jgi:uncharacterized protein (TIGR02147 family)